ncbi:hypothetical protein JZX86_28500 [Agrobacterium rosae]|uniref:nSTAND3 domain-containing NTPase n=1 Tax=Agrobacterium rosae TaxID=1972867 RepID=UPI0019D32FC9|nr:hypothetical protein [Agrobacterium rosae]MBN7809263.1 hypothetical protein [Agrobacterium rosae]
MKYDLSQLGWKAFQDLAAAVAAEILKRPVQTFLGTNDGGRDAAFLGRWDGTDKDGCDLKSTIQCKFSEKPGANLVLSDLTDELPKAAKLAEEGLAEDYIILTNAGISGEMENRICTAFEEVGVKKCRVFGGTWISQHLIENARLRMLVPRVYGIGDLSHIITGHGYKQAKAILDSMGSDLSCFVPTDAYRSSVKALQEHGFVILLGDPASGKSTIAAILALGAIDDGCLGALKINSPEQLNLWHPGEKQFLWVDDAFGPNHFDVSRMSRWNADLGTLRAAVDGGARVVFTSRNYIWEAARPHLKMSSFPLFKESQVVVNVNELSAEERAQMLYNHVRRIQPKDVRQQLKPFLKYVADNRKFLPETARRLGDPLFTKKLAISSERLARLVEHPIEFLTEVLEQLDDPCRAAIALIFLNSQTGVMSPITQSPALEMVTRLLGVQSAEVARAMQHLNDSLTRLVSADDANRWVFRHPTVSDAFATLVAASPELVELYAHGAKLDRLLDEVACQSTAAADGRVRIPPSLYDGLIDRLRDYPLDETLKSFLGARCDKAFLELVLKARGDILEWAAQASRATRTLSGKLLIAALASHELIPDEVRKSIVKEISTDSIHWLNAKPLTDKVIRQIFKDAEFADYAEAFRKEWLSDIPSVFQEFGRYSSGDEIGLYTDFKENLQEAQSYFGLTDDEAFRELYSEIDSHIEQLEAEKDPPDHSGWSPSSVKKSEEASSDETASIFHDVDA